MPQLPPDSSPLNLYSCICSSPDVDSSIRVHVAGIATLAASWTNTHFTLDTSGVAGFFAGDVALSAMVTTHIYAGRWRIRFYNQPGSYEVARRYGQLAQSCFWDALFPGPNVDPASLFHFHGPQRGPSYMSVDKTSIVFWPYTGYIARLFLDECKATKPCRCPLCPEEDTAPGSVTVVELEAPPKLQSTPAQLAPTTTMKFAAALPVLASVTTSTLCVLLGDWYCCSMIVLGMACNGLMGWVAGRAPLEFRLFDAPGSKGSTRRTGVLYEENDFIVMNGEIGALDAVTHGRFEVRYGTRPHHHDLGCCALLLSLQLLAQLLIVPQGHLYGQLLFLASFAFSWGYNSYLSSPDVATLLRTALFKKVLCLERYEETHPLRNINVKKYKFKTRTATVVFTLLLIVPSTPPPGPPPERPEDNALLGVLNCSLPELNTPVGKRWKAQVVKSIEAKRHELRTIYPSGHCFRFNFDRWLDSEKAHRDEFEELRRLCEDADEAALMYSHYRK